MYERKLYEQDKKIDNLIETQNQLVGKIEEIPKIQERAAQFGPEQAQDGLNINEEMQIYEQEFLERINNLEQVLENIRENTHTLIQANMIL